MKEYINKQRDRRKGHGGTRGRDTEGQEEGTRRERESTL